jgi:hypothetical protein
MEIIGKKRTNKNTSDTKRPTDPNKINQSQLVGA